jgi:hypothetical protein
VRHEEGERGGRKEMIESWENPNMMMIDDAHKDINE